MSQPQQTSTAAVLGSAEDYPWTQSQGFVWLKRHRLFSQGTTLREIAVVYTPTVASGYCGHVVQNQYQIKSESNKKQEESLSF